MCRTSFLVIILTLLNTCKKNIPLERVIDYTYIETDSIRTFNDSTFLALKSIPNDSLYIINFWANRSQKSLKNRIFLNETQNNRFQLIQINLEYKPALLNVIETFKKNDFYYKPSSYSIVDSSWNGLLPATLFITKDTLIFTEDALLQEKDIQEKLNLLE